MHEALTQPHFPVPPNFAKINPVNLDEDSFALTGILKVHPFPRRSLDAIKGQDWVLSVITHLITYLKPCNRV